MRNFEFASAGITVLFLGKKLCLSPEILWSMEDRYVGRVSDVTLRKMLVVTQNVCALSAHAVRKGREAVFGTTTFAYDNEYMAQQGWSKQLAAELKKYRIEMRRLTHLECVWVLQRNGVNERLHQHEVWSGRLDLELVEKAKKRAVGIGRCNVIADVPPLYLTGEMGKRVGLGGTGIRILGAMGRFEGKSGVRDFLLDSPMAECRRLAWRVRRRAEPYRLAWERAKEIFQKWLRGEVSLGRKYDRFRERYGGRDWRDADFKLNGDACEDGGGDRDFDVGEAA